MSSPQATDPERFLAAIFDRSGCIREPNLPRRRRDKQKYKKGYEVRLTARTKQELATIRKMLRKAGFEPGTPYHKVNQIVQPIYGKGSLERFRRMIEGGAGG